jgi:hypothetical protein
LAEVFFISFFHEPKSPVVQDWSDIRAAVNEGRVKANPQRKIDETRKAKRLKIRRGKKRPLKGEERGENNKRRCKW